MSGKDIVEKGTKKDLAVYNSYKQLKAIATDLFDSGLFTHLKNPQQAIAIVEYGRELGIPPMQALQTMAVINGKIGMEAKMQMGLAKRAGYDMEIKKESDEECVIEFLSPNGKSRSVSFTMKEAKQLGIAGKDNWRKQPANMLLQRAISKAVRRYAPEAMLDDGSGTGMYTIEELSGGEVISVEDIKEQEAVEVEKEAEKEIKAQHEVVDEAPEAEAEDEEVKKKQVKKVTEKIEKNMENYDEMADYCKRNKVKYTQKQLNYFLKLYKSHTLTTTEKRPLNTMLCKEGMSKVISYLADRVHVREKVEDWLQRESKRRDIVLNAKILKYITEDDKTADDRQREVLAIIEEKPNSDGGKINFSIMAKMKV